MTIASEITRLQNDKAAICTAIENKGVTVGNVNLDSYAACIDAIPTGSSDCFIDILAVGGGGGGGGASCFKAGGGGGGGGVIMVNAKTLCNSIPVVIGAGGAGGAGCNTESCAKSGTNGGNTSVCNVRYLCGSSLCTYLTAFGGGGGGKGGCSGCNGGSGGGAGKWSTSSHYNEGGRGCRGQGNAGGLTKDLRCDCLTGAGGGGYLLSGCPNWSACSSGICPNGGWGTNRAKGYSFCFAGGGGGGASTSAGGYGTGSNGGGNGGAYKSNGGNATGYGSGGGGAGACGNLNGGNGSGGAVVISRPADGSYGFTTATGGNCCTCVSGCCVRMFTSNGTFTIVS